MEWLPNRERTVDACVSTVALALKCAALVAAMWAAGALCGVFACGYRAIAGVEK